MGDKIIPLIFNTECCSGREPRYYFKLLPSLWFKVHELPDERIRKNLEEQFGFKWSKIKKIRFIQAVE